MMINRLKNKIQTTHNKHIVYWWVKPLGTHNKFKNKIKNSHNKHIVYCRVKLLGTHNKLIPYKKITLSYQMN